MLMQLETLGSAVMASSWSGFLSPASPSTASAAIARLRTTLGV